MQAYHDEVLETLVSAAVPGLKALQGTIPSPLALTLLAVFDVALVAGFAGWASLRCGFKLAVALVAVGVIVMSRRAAKRA